MDISKSMGALDMWATVFPPEARGMVISILHTKASDAKKFGGDALSVAQFLQDHSDPCTDDIESYSSRMSLNASAFIVAADLLRHFAFVDMPARIIREVFSERMAQDRQWGGHEHDDSHGPGDWLDFIQKQHSAAYADVGSSQYRARLVKIAALAVAAIESHDRLSGPLNVHDIRNLDRDEELDRVRAENAQLRKENEELRCDRDEWREQHENAIACWHQERDHLGKKVDELKKREHNSAVTSRAIGIREGLAICQRTVIGGNAWTDAIHEVHNSIAELQAHAKEETREERLSRRFSAVMLTKLREKAHKGGWNDLTVFKLYDLMMDEVKELSDALMNGTPLEVARECADVANFAGMIADRMSGLDAYDEQTPA